MTRFLLLAFLLALLAVMLGTPATGSVLAAAQTRQDAAIKAVIDEIFAVCGPDKPHELSDAIYRICTPPKWWFHNNDLVIWAHGYVDFTQPVEIPEDQMCLPDGSLCIADVVAFMGYDFATTSYAVTGLAIVPGIQDVRELIDLYTAEQGPPDNVYLVGASEGGIITALAVEDYPDEFDAGLATCGPVGDFNGQISYFGDFRAVLDYFFPGLIPGSPVDIPPELIENWDEYYETVVYPELIDPANRDLLRQLISVTDVPYDPNNLEETLSTTVEEVLWYNIYATNNAVEVLGGQPFDNMTRIYRGSDDDVALNRGIQRLPADQAALDEIEANYQTSGVLVSPLVTLHTILDQQVPYWHEELYLQKTMASGAWPTLHQNWPPPQVYGHCMFPIRDVLGAFNLMLEMAGDPGLDPEQVDALLKAVGPDTLMTLHSNRSD